MSDQTHHGVALGDSFTPFNTLRERADRTAAGLRSLGVAPGDVIAVFARNAPALLEVTLSAGRLGATVVPVNTAWRGDEVRYVLEDSRAKVLFGQVDLVRGMLQALPPGLPVIVQYPVPEVVEAFGIDATQLAPLDQFPRYDTWRDGFAPIDSDKPATAVSSVFYTSGTTGKPKGVLRDPPTPEQSVHRLKVLQTCYGIEEGARSLITTPLYHVFASAHALTTLAKNGLVVLLPKFDAETLLALIERHRITNLQLVPTMFVRLLRLPAAVRQRYDLSSLRHVLHTGAPCAPDIKRAMIDWWGPVLWEQYGSSETGVCVLTDSEAWLKHPGTVGKAFLGSRVAVYGPDGKTVPPGTVGDIYMRMPGSPDFSYIGRPEARAEMERDGLLTAGDVGYLDDDGYLYLSDRRADIVISGGTNIYPAEIEAVLSSLPGVSDCAVIGRPDAEYGERLAAYVVRDTGAAGSALDAEAVKAHVRERLAVYKVPKDVVFVPQLPRDDGGKIIRRKVRDLAVPPQTTA